MLGGTKRGNARGEQLPHNARTENIVGPVIGAVLLLYLDFMSDWSPHPDTLRGPQMTDSHPGAPQDLT